MCAAHSGSLSSTSTTRIAVASCSSSASRPAASRERCCTMSIGAANVGGSARTIVVNACNPPHEAPTTTTWSGPVDVPSHRLGGWTFARSRGTAPPSLDLPVELLGGDEGLVAALELREAQRLLAPQRQDPEHRQAVVEEPVHPGL